MQTPLIYGELAPWWPLLSAPADYAEDAALISRLLDAAADGAVRTVLELGSGGGNNASHLAGRLQLTLVDRSPQMLAVSRALNPTCEHLAGDMRAVRLRRTFDAVLVHDAVTYMTTSVDLRAALATAFAHCRPGGAALFMPDCVCETFAPTTSCGGSDADDGRGLRYLEWLVDPDPADTTYEVHYALLCREADGSMRVAEDHHRLGVFPRAEWLALLGEAGFEAARSHHDRVAGAPVECFVARRPA